MKIPSSYFTTIFVAGSSTLAVAIASAFVGYGLARFNFRFKFIIFAFMLFTYIMPKTLFFIPTYQIYTTLKIKGTLWSILIPALTGQGIQGAFFILIFYQFFKMIPKQMKKLPRLTVLMPYRLFIKLLFQW